MTLFGQSAALVTGAETSTGAAIAQALAESGVFSRVLCVHGTAAKRLPVDSTRMRHVIIDLTRSRDVRNLLCEESSRDVSTIIHVPFQGERDKNAVHAIAPVVDATQRLLVEAQECAHIARVVVLSSAEVYRIGTREPMLIDEDHSLELSADASPLVRHLVETDLVTCARIGTSRLQVIVLRCSEILSPGGDGHITDYLSSRLCLRPLGFDPMLNVLSIPDLTQAVSLAARSTAHGIFNIPGADTLPLSQLVHAAGRIGMAMPGPALAPLYALRRLTSGLRFRYADQRRLFHFGAILDGRKAQLELGYVPSHPVDFSRLK